MFGLVFGPNIQYFLTNTFLQALALFFAYFQPSIVPCKGFQLFQTLLYCKHKLRMAKVPLEELQSSTARRDRVNVSKLCREQSEHVEEVASVRLDQNQTYRENPVWQKNNTAPHPEL
ncbi:hypothetical protein ILYODFUR_001241 [Ilyodon furcidens]|uniref:Uncharacterized protein n=1 Tax=Ilyodon furcidens TaxID=33524 RepID=A0ABV0TF47_9TELE